MSYRLRLCGPFSLRFGTIFSGIACIILAIVAIILLWTVNVHYRTIIFDIDKTVARIIFTINLCMTIFISTLMLVGAVRKNTVLMLPWVVLGVLLLVGLLVSILYTSIMLFFQDDVKDHVLLGFIFLVFGLATVVIYTFFWWVVYSYFEQLRAEKWSHRIDPYGRHYNYQRPKN